MSDTITNQLRKWAERRHLSAPGSAWQRLEPTRTNTVWRIDAPDGTASVLKLFAPSRATPLFPNDADADWQALEWLRGSDLAPAPRARALTPWGPIIVSGFVHGKEAFDADLLGRGLSALHALEPPPGLRHLVLSRTAILAKGHAMLGDCDARLQAELAALAPASPPSEPVDRMAFLHGDPVPSNVLLQDGRAVFIDWQCPAAGDPVFDLACALSPSMRLSCGVPPLGESDIDAVLAAHGDAAAADRFRRWRATFTWVFACYAAWCDAHGRGVRGPGLKAELALLKQLGQ